MNKEKQALEKDVAIALLAAGYTKINKHKFKKSINPETELFVYPGVRSGRTFLQLEPIVGFENVTLSARLKALNPKEDARVCHIHLGFIDGVRDLWGGFFSLYWPKGKPTMEMVRLFIAALDQFAIPKLGIYDSTEKVIALLRLYSQSPRNTDVVIPDAKEKLALLTSH